MYKMDYNRSNNRITVTFNEMPYGTHLPKYQEDLIREINKAHKGFTILFDMTSSGIKSMGEQDKEGAEALRNYCLDKGFKGFAYAIKSGTLKAQMKRVLRGTGVEDIVFDSFEEAENMLNKL